ncbi:MAG: DUF192 domain-containing protein [Bacteroidales bacterium]|nr:DUF192 domain-containing protein [Bacteroidales bacterium]
MTKQIIIILIIILTSCIACHKKDKKKPNPNIPPKFVVVEEPKFRKEGELFFIFTDINDTITKIDIEIADNPNKRDRGLMFRRSMPDSAGMFFIFDKAERQSFWMKNTIISLDIIYVNENYDIVNIYENTKPYSLKSLHSIEYAKYVVEVNAGFCKKFSIKIGDKIDYKIKE